MMTIGVAGVSHHAAPVAVRERFVLSWEQVEKDLGRVLDAGAAQEALLLSTCNRTELYVVGSSDAAMHARDLLIEHAGLGPAGGEFVYIRRGREAAEHLFRVTAGLDSMIVGEAQIQGQVRTAYEVAQRAAAVGPVLSRLSERALSLGAQVRTDTGLGKRGGSVATAVVEVARKIFGELAGRRALVVGAGEMSELVLDAFRAKAVESTIVASRGEERARAVAQRLGIDAARFEALPDLLPQADLLVSATAAPHAVIRRTAVEAAITARRRPLLIVDLALPRDVEPEIGAIDNVFLYDMDDLHHVIERREAWWQSEVARAEAMVRHGVDEFQGWYRSRSAVPLIRELRDRVDGIRDAELDRVLRRLAHLSPEDRAAVERLAEQIAAKILHAPMVRLREAARADDDVGVELLEAARFLFQLNQPDREPEDGWSEDTGVA